MTFTHAASYTHESRLGARTESSTALYIGSMGERVAVSMTLGPFDRLSGVTWRLRGLDISQPPRTWPRP